jgi:hypothetical protein
VTARPRAICIFPWTDRSRPGDFRIWLVVPCCSPILSEAISGHGSLVLRRTVTLLQIDREHGSRSCHIVHAPERISIQLSHVIPNVYPQIHTSQIQCSNIAWTAARSDHFEWFFVALQTSRFRLACAVEKFRTSRCGEMCGFVSPGWAFFQLWKRW